MADMNDIIVLDDDDDDEGPSNCIEKKSPPRLLPPEPRHNKTETANKPQKAAQSAENQRLFEEFVHYCTRLTYEHPDVIPFLRARFSKANPTYLASVEFRNTLGNCFTRLKNKQSKVFVYINDLITALKVHSAKRKVTLKPQAAASSSQLPVKEETTNSLEKEEAQEQVEEKKSGSKRQIRYLENLLRLYSQEIRKLQEKELSLDDMEDEDSSYIQESRLKRKLLRIFEKLCELKDCSSSTGRVIEQRILYQGTRYPEINRHLERFINKTWDDFPDYGDVFKVVDKANSKYNLRLTRKQLQSIAQDSFRDLGNKLQQRRRLDMAYNFGCHLTDTYKKGYDPAEQDMSLSRRLRENRGIAENRLEDVIKKYADMQDDGEHEEWKRPEKDGEKPSTSKDVRLQRTRPTPPRRSGKDEEDEEDEESEESEVDIEDELLKSEQVGDDDDDEVSEDLPGEEEHEADQKMEEESVTSDRQNLSPGNEVAANDGGDAEEDKEVIEEEEEEDREDEEQESSSSSSSLSPEQDTLNTSLESKADVASPASPDCDTSVILCAEEEPTEQEKDIITDCIISDWMDAGDQTKDQLEDSGLEEDVVESKGEVVETADVPYVEVNTPPCVEQGAEMCTQTRSESPVNAESLLTKRKASPLTQPKEVKVNRLDKCISKIAGSLSDKGSREKKGLAERETPPSSDSDRECSSPVNNKSSHSGSPLGLHSMDQSSNGKLVCVDAPTNSRNSVRKISFSRPLPVDESTDVLHLDSCKDGAHSDASNGVHKATIRQSTPINRLKLRKNTDSPKKSMISVKLQADSPSSRKRKGVAHRWTENGLSKCNGTENGENRGGPNSKRTKYDRSSPSSPYTPLSNTSEPGSDNEHDLTLDLVVTCSPPETPNKSPVRHVNKLDVSTQCDPDEVIVLSD